MRQQMLVVFLGFTMLQMAACTGQPDTKGGADPQVKAPPGTKKSDLPRWFADDPSKFPKDADELVGGKTKFVFDDSKMPYIEVDHWKKGRQFLPAEHHAFTARSGTDVVLTLYGASYHGNTAYKLTYRVANEVNFLKAFFYEFPAGLDRHVPTPPLEIDARGGRKSTWSVCFGENCQPREGESLEETARRAEYAIVVTFGQQEKAK